MSLLDPADVDPAEEVARIVAAESGWVPHWHRILVRTAAVGIVSAVLLGRCGPPEAAVVATSAALVSRIGPWVVAAALRRRATRGPVRSARERLLLLTAAAGLVTLLSVVAAVPSPPAVATCVCAAAVIVAPHRSGAGLGALLGEVVEALALVALLPCLALATRGWWS